MDATIEAALTEAGVQARDLDAIAVTIGPGLSLCLKVGTRGALALLDSAICGQLLFNPDDFRSVFWYLSICHI